MISAATAPATGWQSPHDHRLPIAGGARVRTSDRPTASPSDAERVHSAPDVGNVTR
jgi:hypothetical protein